MGRKYIDCRETPSQKNCSVTIAADSDDELMEAAVQHVISVHEGQDTPELRQEIRQHVHEGAPPA